MSFPVAIPQSEPLVSGDPRDHRAPAVAAGEAFGIQVELADIEASTRKRLRDIDGNVVRPNELKESRRRLEVLKTTEAQVRYGMGNEAVLAAVNALTTQVQDLATQIQDLATKAQVKDLATQVVQGLATRIQGLENKVDAKFRNQVARQNNLTNNWTCLVVECPGVNVIGTIPPHHPPSRQDIYDLMHDAIDVLEREFNLPDGYFVGGDDVNTRRDAVLTYMTLG